MVYFLRFIQKKALLLNISHPANNFLNPLQVSRRPKSVCDISREIPQLNLQIIKTIKDNNINNNDNNSKNEPLSASNNIFSKGIPINPASPSPEKKNIRIRSTTNTNNAFMKNSSPNIETTNKITNKTKTEGFFMTKTPNNWTGKSNHVIFFQTPKSSPKKTQFSHHESIFKPHTAFEKSERPKMAASGLFSPKSKFEKTMEFPKEEKKESPKEAGVAVNRMDIYNLKKQIRFVRENNGETAMRETQSNRFFNIIYREFIGFL